MPKYSFAKERSSSNRFCKCHQTNQTAKSTRIYWSKRSFSIAISFQSRSH